jgi:hypothetical protein
MATILFVNNQSHTLNLRPMLRLSQSPLASLARLPLRLRAPRPSMRRPIHAVAGYQGRTFASFRDAVTMITSALAKPIISSVFNSIQTNEAIGLRLHKFSKRFPDWEGPLAFVEGCGCALQALMEMTNNRCFQAILHV